MLSTKEKLHLAISLLQEVMNEQVKSYTISPAARQVINQRTIEGNSEQIPLPLPAYDETAILSQGQAAAFLGMATSTVAILCKKKKLPFTQPTGPKGYRKFRVSDLQDYMKKTTHRG